MQKQQLRAKTVNKNWGKNYENINNAGIMKIIRISKMGDNSEMIVINSKRKSLLQILNIRKTQNVT